MRKILSIFIVFAFLATLPVPALAADEAGAVAVKKMVEDALQDYIEMGKTGEGLTLGGDIAVTPKGSYYEVKLPDAAFVSQGSKAMIGTIMMNVSPDADGNYLTSIALPQVLKMTDTTGKPVVELNLGQQKFSGVWSPVLEIFTKAEVDYSDITGAILDPKDPLTIKIGHLKSIVNLSDNKDGTWSGPRSTLIENILLTPTDGLQSSISIDSLSGNMHYDRVDFAAAKKLKDEYREKAGLALHNKSPDALKPEDARALFESSWENMSVLPNGLHNSFALSGLKVDINPPPAMPGEPATSPLKFTLATAQLNSDFNGLKEEIGNVDLKFNMDGLNVLQAAPEVIGVIPTKGSINIVLDKLPMKNLTQTFMAAVKQAMETSMAVTDAATTAQREMLDKKIGETTAMALASVPQQLKEAGSSLVIRNTFFNAPDLVSTLDGQFLADAASPFMAVGAMTLNLTGLDELIEKLKAIAKQEPTSKAAGYAQALLFLQFSGQISKNADGRSERSYKLEVTPDGKVLMNGADFGGIAGGLTGQK